MLDKIVYIVFKFYLGSTQVPANTSAAQTTAGATQPPTTSGKFAVHY
tara:strand:- start:70 stop:210 length:141 start_codon:yes stop_codon:yes gene_type:complete